MVSRYEVNLIGQMIKLFLWLAFFALPLYVWSLGHVIGEIGGVLLGVLIYGGAIAYMIGKSTGGAPHGTTRHR